MLCDLVSSFHGAVPLDRGEVKSQYTILLAESISLVYM